MKVNQIIKFLVLNAVIDCLFGITLNQPATTVLAAGLLAVGLIESTSLIAQRLR